MSALHADSGWLTAPSLRGPRAPWSHACRTDASRGFGMKIAETADRAYKRSSVALRRESTLIAAPVGERALDVVRVETRIWREVPVSVNVVGARRLDHRQRRVTPLADDREATEFRRLVLIARATEAREPAAALAKVRCVGVPTGDRLRRVIQRCRVLSHGEMSAPPGLDERRRRQHLRVVKRLDRRLFVRAWYQRVDGRLKVTCCERAALVVEARADGRHGQLGAIRLPAVGPSAPSHRLLHGACRCQTRPWGSTLSAPRSRRKSGPPCEAESPGRDVRVAPHATEISCRSLATLRHDGPSWNLNVIHAESIVFGSVAVGQVFDRSFDNYGYLL